MYSSLCCHTNEFSITTPLYTNLQTNKEHKEVYENGANIFTYIKMITFHVLYSIFSFDECARTRGAKKAPRLGFIHLYGNFILSSKTIKINIFVQILSKSAKKGELSLPLAVFSLMLRPSCDIRSQRRRPRRDNRAVFPSFQRLPDFQALRRWKELSPSRRSQARIPLRSARRKPR